MKARVESQAKFGCLRTADLTLQCQGANLRFLATFTGIFSVSLTRSGSHQPAALIHCFRATNQDDALGVCFVAIWMRKALWCCSIR